MAGRRGLIGIYCGIQPAVRDALAELGEPVSMAGIAALPDHVRANVVCVVTSAMRGVDNADLDLLPGLKTIVSCGAGRDRYDIADLARRSITLQDTAEVVIADTAEMGVALTVALARDIVAADAFVRSGRWSHERFGPRRRLAGSTVGVVGLGRVGSLVAEKLACLGCEIAYTARSAKAERPWQFKADIVELARWADFLILCCPGGEAIHHLVNADVLEALGSRGFVINISRGSVIDEPALIAALEKGRIAGAALDVFENEPTPDASLLGLRNVILTPHTAAVTDRYVDELASVVTRAVRNATA